MKFCVILMVTISTIAATTHEKWAEFKLTHKRQYGSPEEEQKRFAIFAKNLAEIEEHNLRHDIGELTYSKAMNKFGDMTGTEFLQFINRIKPIETRGELHKLTKEASDEFDWRTQNVLTEIKNQGNSGPSWSFSVTGAVESHLAIKTGELVVLSEQNLIDCSTGGVKSAFEYIQADGIMSEEAYPHEGANGTCRFDPAQSVVTISGYVEIDSMNETSLQNAVGTVGPVAASIDATENLQFYYGGILIDDKCNLNMASLNHAVLVVGYGRESQYDYWIVRNSWGKNWGENGYYMSIRNYGNNCGIATAAVYPIL